MKHPSNQFYEGQCTSIDNALDLNVSQFRFEKGLWPEEEKVSPTFTNGLKEAEALRSEYMQKINNVRDKLMKEWLTREGQAQSIAEAYFSGDYSILAI